MTLTNDKNAMLLDILKEAISIEIYGREYYSRFSELVDDENASKYYLDQGGSWYGYSPPTLGG